MNADSATWCDAGTLDDLFVSLAEGQSSAVPRLLSILRTVPREPLSQWPAEAAAAWRDGLELAIEALDRSQLRPYTELLLAICDIGFDTPAFRDVLAGMVRQTCADYPDPAGLLSALGVRDDLVPTSAVAARWRVFELVRPGVLCYHPPHGLGCIESVDALANEVRVRQARLFHLPLALLLTQATLIRPASWLSCLIKGEEGAREKLRPEQFREHAREGMVSAAPVGEDALKAILVPVALSAEQFADLVRQADARPAGEEPEAAAAVRTWDQARGVTEMVGLIAAAKALEDTHADTANVAAILRAGAERESTANDFTEAVAMLGQAFSGRPWWSDVLQELAPRAVCWNHVNVFVEQTDRLAGRLVSPWLEATAAARGAAYLAQACMELPLRLWTYVERIVAERSGDPRLLLNTVVREVGRGTASADVLLWLYRAGGDESRLLANPPLLFKTLQRPVRGAFIKARKDLYKLLMDDQDFQRLVMRGGDPDGVTSLVRCVKHAPLLDAGERQSLLVKIVRVFPEAIALVEDRRTQPARKPVGRVTSIRSFQLRHRELEHIVNQRIPANARAIAHARSYGDLRENAEYKAAKDEQTFLRARRAELEAALHEVRATDFADASAPECVVPGSTATVRYGDGRTETFHVLGLWDSLPEKRMISYDTPVGRLLLGARVGDSLTMPGGDTVTLSALSPIDEAMRAWLGDHNPSED